VSGIVAVLNRQGGPVAASELTGLTDLLRRRGPDSHASCVSGPIGMGHALLATTREARRESQPRSLDGRFWVTADLRIDARAELIAKLDANVDLSAATDPELLLCAFRQWGEDCVEHLLGDFAFAIWDAARQRLFCARDPFGVKLLYYVSKGPLLIVSNTLACLRTPGSDRLNEAVIADFLLTGVNPDPATTTFADVQALPPGHTLCCSSGGSPALRRFFSLPADVAPLHYSDPRDYVEHFRALVTTAVDDRLRTDRAAVSMSGGLDSTMIAATAARLRAEGCGARELHAYTHVFDALLPHDEAPYAAMVGESLGLPIRYLSADRFYTSRHWLQTHCAPEPMSQYAAAHLHACCGPIARGPRVVLTGFDGDALLAFSLPAHWRSRVRRVELGALARELGWHVAQRRLPRIGLRSALRNRWYRRRNDPDGGYPRWFASDFEAQVGLHARWQRAQHRQRDAGVRSAVLAHLSSAILRVTLTDMDPGMTGMPVEYRHPLLDLRVIRFCLALPPHPWCHEKALFRRAMRGELPDAVITRPKTPLADDPRAAGLARRDFLGAWRPAPELARYVDVARLRSAVAHVAADATARAELALPITSAFALDAWLHGQHRRPAVEATA
jgi:asparagine synthase (glutamine-hydrolysing)